MPPRWLHRCSGQDERPELAHQQRPKQPSRLRPQHPLVETNQHDAPPREHLPQVERRRSLTQRGPQVRADQERLQPRQHRPDPLLTLRLTKCLIGRPELPRPQRIRPRGRNEPLTVRRVRQHEG